MPPVIGAAIALAGAVGAGAAASAIGGTLGGLVGGVVAVGAGLAGSWISNLGRSKKPQKIQAPKALSLDYSQQIKENLTGTVQPVPIVYGIVEVPGIRVYGQVGPSPFYLYEIFVFCEGEIDSFVTLKIDDVDYTDSKFSGKLSTWQWVGTDNQISITGGSPAFDGPNWTSAHRLQGFCFGAIKCNKDATVFPRVASVSAVLKGKKVYDFRNGNTAYSTNPVLCIYDYLTSTRYGCGISAGQINFTSFIEAANYCEEVVLDLDGTMKYRYELSGIIDTSRTVIENLKEMLTTCRGMLTYVGGQYRLIIDKPEVSTFAFTEDNITGAWKITRVGKRFRKNRIEGTFRNKATNWQPDLYVSESPFYKSLYVDGEPIIGKVDLPLTVTVGLANRLIVPMLKQSRLDRRVEFTATMEALQVEPGNVVSITHSTPGYVGKLFRVMRMVLLSTDEVQIVAEEYSDSVYDLTTLDDRHAFAAFSVDSPSNLTIHQTIQNGRNVITLHWEPSDSEVAYYQAEMRQPCQDVFFIQSKTLQTSAEIGDMKAGLYEFRVKAVSSLNQSSDYIVRTVRIVSASDVPANVSGFAMARAGNYAILSWDANTDTVSNGFFKIRHSPNTSGAAWSDAPTFEVLVPGSWRGVALGIIKGTYLIKSVNIAGTESAGVSSAVMDTGDDGYGIIIQDTESPAFAGAKTNTAAVDHILELDSAVLFDSGVGNFDSGTGNFDDSGGFKTSGSYQHDQPVDLGVVLPVRLKQRLQADYPDLTHMFDSGAGNFDSGTGNFDGTDVLSTLTQYYRTTNNDPNNSPTWSAWQALTTNDVTARGIDFKVDFSAPDANHNARIYLLAALVTMAARADVQTLTISQDGLNILYNRSFWSMPILTAIIQDYQTGDSLAITGQTANGFTVQARDAYGAPVSRTVSYVAIGAGYR
jgi:hypothetical protein